MAANAVYLLLSWPLHYLSGTLGLLEEGKGKGRENMDVACGEPSDSIPGVQNYNQFRAHAFLCPYGEHPWPRFGHLISA